MNRKDECPICDSPAEIHSEPNDQYFVECPRCSTFRITYHARVNAKTTDRSERETSNISSWLRANPGTVIESNNLDSLSQVRAPSFSERAELLLQFIESECEYEGDTCSFMGHDIQALVSAGWCIHQSELHTLLFRYMEETRGWIEGSTLAEIYSITITPRGYEYLDSIRRKVSDLPNGFCAMWFDRRLQPVWTEAIEPAIHGAGYNPVRIDKVEHSNRVDDEIIAQIRRSRFLIADFTGQRGGVYFEAGFALGLGIPVIWTIRKNRLHRVHFDNRQYNFIQWDENNLEPFKEALQNRIEALLGRGPIA